ncbi:MAG: SDR family oxidoreductase [Hyphomicrobiales bacterium]|nr:SDR family oxidoreductase [Hyphomicrobiales bacterium]MBV9909211.1 SDR family oxidoreductase [Hyphomicrobiales bacterium]
MVQWTSDDIPPLEGRSVVVTGAGGLGFEDVIALSRAGARVIVAGRNSAKGAQAVSRIRSEVHGANVRFETLDLADLRSVQQFGSRLCRDLASLDILINNAGVMTPPTRKTTLDGFELQFGTNHLGHFALTAHLLPLLRKGADPRVISLSSIAARQGRINFDDLQSEKNYKAFQAYAQSKLACLLFALELQRRSEISSWGVSSIAAHPGLARTDLLANGPGRGSAIGVVSVALSFLFQASAQGALPTLFAATSPAAKGGAYYGPDKLGETRGYPAPARVPPRAKDAAVAARLWEVSEQLTGVTFSARAP